MIPISILAPLVASIPVTATATATVPDPPPSSPSAPPPLSPSAPLPPPGFIPDPVATHPAGLDPATLSASASASDSASDSASAPHPPLHLTTSALAAALTYANHPTRSSGTELTARVSLYRGLSWAAHAAYTVDEIAPLHSPSSTATYQDLQLGGRVALPTSRPAWLTATAHALLGDTAAAAATATGNGDAVYLSAGTHLAGLDVELGAGATELDGNTGLTGALRATRREGPLTGWLELDAGDATISGASATNLAGAAGLDLHLGRVTLDLASYLGDRALAITDEGELVEAVPDTFHASTRALVDVGLGRVHAYLGGSARTATTPTGTAYSLYAGFAGLTLTF